MCHVAGAEQSRFESRFVPGKVLTFRIPDPMTMSSEHRRWTTARPAAGLFILALGRLCCADCIGASCAATGASLLALKAETQMASASLGDLEGRAYPINMTVNGSNGTVDTQLEMIVGENAEQDMKEMNSIPNPENASSNGTHGMGELARNLEFLMLKIVQLETVVEMQQHEIQDLAVSCPSLGTACVVRVVTE